jgi:hypothetical protein
MVTQHYYRAGPSTNDTMQLLLQPDSFLHTLVANIVGAAAGHCPLGARIDETGSYSAGGVQGVSDVYGAALWSLDYLFTVALNGGQGINFHGGGQSPYSPIVDNGTTVQRVGPEFYGLKMFSVLPHGNVVPATVTLASNINFTAYGVKCTSGGISALLNNKETSNTVAVSINLGPYVSGLQLIVLTGLSLYSTTGYTLSGATINPVDGTWNGGVQAVLPATNGQLTVVVPPISAFLLNPVLAPPRNRGQREQQPVSLELADELYRLAARIKFHRIDEHQLVSGYWIGQYKPRADYDSAQPEQCVLPPVASVRRINREGMIDYEQSIPV